MAVLGCDISVWQDNNSTPQMVDFVKMKSAGAEFVFIKASQGTYKDSDYILNWQHAKDAGIIRGAYHFLDWGYNVLSQADYFSTLINSDPGDLPPVLDYESRVNVPARATASANCLAFCKRVEEKTGRIPIIYTSPSFWNEYGSTSTEFRRYPLWIANYYVASPTIPSPWQKWHFWQWTPKGDGPLYGAESSSIDLNYWNGTLEELKIWAGITPPPPTLEERVAILESNAVQTEKRLKALEAAMHTHLNMPIISK